MEIPLIIIVILALEAIIIISRLIFGSARNFWKARKIPHIHHLFFGIILLFFYKYWYFLEMAIALIANDLFHHFIVLPIWIGETEFP
jgi:hypothetical protein